MGCSPHRQRGHWYAVSSLIKPMALIKTPIMKEITILLAEDTGVVQRKVRKILRLADDPGVIGDAKDARAVALAKKVRSTFVLLHVAMLALNGLLATCQGPNRPAGFQSNPLSSFIHARQLIFRGCSFPSHHY